MEKPQMYTHVDLPDDTWRQQGKALHLPPHVRRIRTKIEVDPSQPVILKTVRGYGYRLDVR